jgi:hypothetical protein
MKEQKEKLFSDFTAPSRQEWRDKIEVDLKGADYQKKMVWRTNEGFSMEPFYRKEDVDKLPLVNALPGEFPFVRGNKKQDNQWYVRKNIVADAPKEITEDTISQYLETRFMPDPELLIRTGGEKRISNYLLWQIAYSELYFCDTYWPDFDEDALHLAIADYQGRQRRFGKTEAQVESEASPLNNK